MTVLRRTYCAPGFGAGGVGSGIGELLLLVLEGVELMVAAVEGQQLLVCTLLDNLTLG